jgi:carboxylesterase type B
LQAYPEDTSVEILQNLPLSYELGAPYGAEYRRAATYYGDQTFVAGRRLTCKTWASSGLPVYSYRFNAIPAGYTQEQGATHFVEVAFAMLNLEGVGYEPVRRPPFEGKPESYRDLAKLMSGDYVSFVSTMDPNTWRTGPGAPKIAAGAPLWPRYDSQNSLNFVFDANVTSHVENDTWRSQGIDLINSANLEVYDR